VTSSVVLLRPASSPGCRIQLAGQHRPNLGRLDVTRVRFERDGELALDRFALLRPVEEHGQIVSLLADRGGQRPILFEAAPPLQNLLRGALILPEVWRRRLRFDLGQFAREAGFVKVPSARLRRARKGQ
jgi:hypothetical protein